MAVYFQRSLLAAERCWTHHSQCAIRPRLKLFYFNNSPMHCELKKRGKRCVYGDGDRLGQVRERLAINSSTSPGLASLTNMQVREEA